MRAIASGSLGPFLAPHTPAHLLCPNLCYEASSRIYSWEVSDETSAAGNSAGPKGAEVRRGVSPG